MKFDKQSLIVGLLVGAIIGGAIIGYVDANRPKPLFSSADYELMEAGGNCDAEWNLAAAYIRRNRVTPQNYGNHPQLISLFQNWQACINGGPQEGGGGPGQLQ